jgi:hypothetical protein
VVRRRRGAAAGHVYTVRDDRIVDIDVFEANQYEVDAFFG